MRDRDATVLSDDPLTLSKWLRDNLPDLNFPVEQNKSPHGRFNDSIGPQGS